MTWGYTIGHMNIHHFMHTYMITQTYLCYNYIFILIWQNIKVNHRFINQIQHPVVRHKTCCRHRLQENNAYLLQSEDRKVGEATDINKGFVFREIY